MTASDCDARLVEVAAQLSVVASEKFVTARKAAVKDAEDADLAAAIAALRKPVVGAWVVNLLAAHDPRALEPAVELADEFRQAVDAGDARALAELASRRRSILKDLTDRAVALAAERGVEPSATARAAVERTLDAALRDPDAAAAVASARLLRPIEATGMDAPDLDGAVSGPFDLGSRVPEETDDLAERRAARDAARAAAEARRHAESAERELERVEERLAAARQRAVALEERLAELERERAKLGSDAETVQREVEDLSDQRTTSRDAARRARTAADRAAT
ncbi:hypothetical protein [Microbacterium sp. MM2322]|uniref:hypothetical protein n=1 Tax=Microbacterium sp. MM2322 TaxID=3157631 RepID=UPI0032D58BC6